MSEPQKKLKAFRLSKETIYRLRHASKITGKTMTRLLEEAVSMHLKLGKEKQA